MRDHKIISLLNSGQRNRGLNQLYKNFPQIRVLILSKGGNEEDAKDIFQEALIVFCNKVKEPDFELTSSIGTYLYSVCWYMWRAKLRKRSSNVDFQDVANVDFEVEDDANAHEERERQFDFVDEALTRLGDKCMKILKMFYYEKENMDQIAKVMQLSSAKIAKNQKYKCLERARKMAREEFKNSLT